MQKNRLMLVIAVVAGIMATVLAFSYISSAKAELERREVEPTLEVLFVVNDLPANHQLTAEDLRSEQVGIETSPGLASGAVKATERDAVLGMHVSAPMPAGVPLLYSNLTPITDVAIKEGYRAMAIDVDSANMMGGILVPGDHVDIIVSYQRPPDPLDPAAYDPTDPSAAISGLLQGALSQAGGSSVPSDWETEVVLTDVRIIAVGQVLTASRQAQMFGLAGVGGSGSTITLELSTDDARTLIRAMAGGNNSLTLLLRPETTPSETTEWTEG